MSTGFFPSFEVAAQDDEKGLRSVRTLDSNEGAALLRMDAENSSLIKKGSVFKTDPLPPAMTSVQSKPSRFDAFQFRVAQFLRSLPRSRRLKIAARPRFHTMPFLCRVDDHDVDDTLP